jgi:hypothetical protein
VDPRDGSLLFVQEHRLTHWSEAAGRGVVYRVDAIEASAAVIDRHGTVFVADADPNAKGRSGVQWGPLPRFETAAAARAAEPVLDLPFGFPSDFPGTALALSCDEHDLLFCVSHPSSPLRVFRIDAEARAFAEAKGKPVPGGGVLLPRRWTRRPFVAE